MGSWGTKPWDDDVAADWFDILLERSDFREHVIKKLQQDSANSAEIRAAASVILMLGQVYIWPIEFLETDLNMAIEKLLEVSKDFEDLAVQEGENAHEYSASIAAEIAVLQARLDRIETPSWAREALKDYL